MALTLKQKANIHAIAVAYKAFHDAIQNRDYNGVDVWGIILRNAQNDLGVVVMSVSDINYHMQIASIHAKQAA